MGDTPRVSQDFPLSAGPDMRDLRAFVEVAATGSFRGAAANLYTSQPSISRAVARLESEFCTALLERGPKGARVTAHGAVLLQEARRLLVASANLKRKVSESDKAALILGATATSARTVLAPFLARWIPLHPDLVVNPVEDSETNLLHKLNAGECDAAIVSGPITPGSLEALRISVVNVLCVLPADHPLGTRPDPISVFNLASEGLLLNGHPFPATKLLFHEFARMGVDPTVVYESSAGQTLAAMAELGLGVAVFGDAVDLRGFNLPVRKVVDGTGQPLTYELYVAWNPGTAPVWLREFAIELATTFRRADGAYDVTASLLPSPSRPRGDVVRPQ